MNLFQIIASNLSCSKHRKAQCDFVICEQNYKSALIQYGIQDGCQRRKILLCFLSYINISEIFMSEICFNCNECFVFR